MAAPGDPRVDRSGVDEIPAGAVTVAPPGGSRGWPHRVPDDEQPSKRPGPYSGVDSWIEQSRQTEASNQIAINNAMKGVNRARQEGVAREIEGLRHSAAMVEQQTHILEAQRDLLQQQQRQADEGRADRRIQYTILTFTASALVAGVVFGVFSVTGSKGWLWVTLVLASVVVVGIALWVVPGGRRKGAPTDLGDAD